MPTTVAVRAPAPTIIRFSAEVGAESPLRDGRDRAIDLDELPLSGELRVALGRWADAASRIVNVEANPAIDELRSSGERLCLRTAAELGPGYDVRWDWLVTSSEIGEGVAVLVLVATVAMCFFGTILLLPYQDAATGYTLLITLVEVPVLAMVAMVIVRRRLRRRTFAIGHRTGG